MARQDDGHSTTITFANYPNVKLWEKEVTPPGVSGGGGKDTTTMRNIAWRTQSPKKLKTLTDCTFVAAYDPAVYTDILAMVNVNQQITVAFPDGEEIAFWGWLDEFTPQRSVEGEQPTAEVKIMPSNQNATGVETAPSLAGGSGS